MIPVDEESQGVGDYQKCAALMKKYGRAHANHAGRGGDDEQRDDTQGYGGGVY